MHEFDHSWPIRWRQLRRFQKVMGSVKTTDAKHDRVTSPTTTKTMYASTRPTSAVITAVSTTTKTMSAATTTTCSDGFCISNMTGRPTTHTVTERRTTDHFNATSATAATNNLFNTTVMNTTVSDVNATEVTTSAQQMYLTPGHIVQADPR